MQHRGLRSETQYFAATEDENFRSELSEAGSPILDSVAKGKDAISEVTAEAMNSAHRISLRCEPTLTASRIRSRNLYRR